MIAVDVNPASFPTGTYSWNSCGNVSFVLQRKAGPKDIPWVSLHFLVKIAPLCVSVQKHRTFGTWVCTAGGGDFPALSLEWFTQQICNLVKGGEKKCEACSTRRKNRDLPAYLWEEVDAVKSHGWLEEGLEETVKVPACSSRQQQYRETGYEMNVQLRENWGWREPNFSWRWGGGDTTRSSSLPLVPPSLCSVIQITQIWICGVMWATPPRHNKAVGLDLG